MRRFASSHRRPSVAGQITPNADKPDEAESSRLDDEEQELFRLKPYKGTRTKADIFADISRRWETTLRENNTNYEWNLLAAK